MKQTEHPLAWTELYVSATMCMCICVHIYSDGSRRRSERAKEPPILLRMLELIFSNLQSVIYSYVSATVWQVIFGGQIFVVQILVSSWLLLALKVSKVASFVSWSSVQPRIFCPTKITRYTDLLDDLFHGMI